MSVEFLTSPEFLCAALFVSVVILLLFGFPVAFSLAGSSMLFAFIAAGFGLFDVSFISALPQRIFSIMRNEVLVAVPLFVFMGVTLERSKIAEELLDNMGKLFGSIRGGLGYSVCIVGALLAASTGIVGATVVTMGLLSLPTMIRRGYSPSLACGSICASGTLGQVIPPSLCSFCLEISYQLLSSKRSFLWEIFRLTQCPSTIYSLAHSFLGWCWSACTLFIRSLLRSFVRMPVQPFRLTKSGKMKAKEHSLGNWLPPCLPLSY